MGKRGSTYASVGRRAGKSEGNGCFPGFKNNKSVNLDSKVDEQTVRGVASAFRDKRGDINQPSGHFSSKFDMGSYLLYSFAFFDKEFQKVSGEYEKQGQPIRIKVGT